MRLIPPQPITLISSSITESAYSEWLSASTYAVGDQVYVTLESDATTEHTPHKIYESLTASNSGNYPPDNADQWLDCGATNRWAMFDNSVSTKTEDATAIIVALNPADWIDTLAFFGLGGTSVDISCETSTLGEIFNESYDLDQGIINDWYDFFFAPFEYAETLIVDVPGLYSGVTVNITINGATDLPAQCGHLVMGRSNDLGDTLYSPTVGITDYSVKETNDFGETVLTERSYAKTGSATINLPSATLDNIATRLSRVRSQPIVWDLNNRGAAATNYGRLVIFGFFSDFDILLQSHQTTTLSISIEGLI